MLMFDESNINRFILELQRFIDHSQFVVVTHNERTTAAERNAGNCRAGGAKISRCR